MQLRMQLIYQGSFFWKIDYFNFVGYAIKAYD